MIDAETDDDDVYFTPASSSNLASLFNTTMLPINQDKDASLTYKPQKQPNVTSEPNIKTNVKYESSVIIFKEVHAFQLSKINKEYISIGNCGFTLVGNEKVNSYNLLLYKNKDNIISSTKPTPSLELVIKINNYISFTDDKSIAWALHFNSETDINEFTKIVSTKCQCKLTQKIESKIIKEDLLETNVEDIKEDNVHSGNLDAEINTPSQNISNSDNHDLTNKPEKTNVKNKVFSIKQDNYLQHVPKTIDSDTSDSSEATRKANILNRVAKLGKKILEKEAKDITDSSDIEENSPKSDPKNKKGKASKHNIIEKTHISHPVEKQDFSPINFLNQRSVSNTQIMVPYQETLIPSPVSTDQLSMFFLENKNSASEIKLNIIKLQSDVNEVLKIVKKNDNYFRSISTQTDSENIIEENKNLLILISQQNDTLEKLKESNVALRSKKEEIISKATENAYEIASLTEKNAKNSSVIQSLNMKINEQEKELEMLKNKVESSSISEDQVVLKKSILTDCESKIKQQMNIFFQEACENFDDGEQYDGKSIKKHLAQTIIHNTYSVLKIIEEMCNEN